ncbi:MAG: amidohydrolase family protein [Anaerolineales bacterium]|nr:amidohydrolase family protein [Anaerolineales bacterium]
MNLSEFHPQPKLVTKETAVPFPKFRVVDAHNHLGEPFGGGWDKRPLAELLSVLQEAHVDHYIDLDGGWGETILQRHLEKFKQPAPEKFTIFGGVDWAKWPEKGHGFGEWAAGRLREQARWGAQGLKIWKPLGLHVRDEQDNLVAIDDPRLIPVWETAVELNWPILIHIADPVAFFDPLTPQNERWEELHNHPDWQFPSPPFPPFLSLMNQLKSLVKRHPQATFIGAHVGCYAENLAWVGQMLDDCPNYYVDISARLGELGRQPYSTRRFFINYADRILFGTDAGPSLAHYHLYYRFLETDDEYFNYSPAQPPPQGRWQIYGINLPDDVLQQVYASNARRIFNL